MLTCPWKQDWDLISFTEKSRSSPFSHDFGAVLVFFDTPLLRLLSLELSLILSLCPRNQKSDVQKRCILKGININFTSFARMDDQGNRSMYRQDDQGNRSMCKWSRWQTEEKNFWQKFLIIIKTVNRCRAMKINGKRWWWCCNFRDPYRWSESDRIAQHAWDPFGQRQAVFKGVTRKD